MIINLMIITHNVQQGGNENDSFILSDPIEGILVMNKALDYDHGKREFKIQIQASVSITQDEPLPLGELCLPSSRAPLLYCHHVQWRCKQPLFPLLKFRSVQVAQA